ncbi:MAG: hypothetical protein WC385_02255 [Candidatus Paceibacterota bacterium]|jgi:hypothetical protein
MERNISLLQAIASKGGVPVIEALGLSDDAALIVNLLRLGAPAIQVIMAVVSYDERFPELKETIEELRTEKGSLLFSPRAISKGKNHIIRVSAVPK